MHRGIIFSFIGCFVIILASISARADDYTTWSYSRKLFLNTTSSGANVTSNYLKVPVLIRLNPGNFSSFSQTLAEGKDIRFAKSNGTHIPYQIERWKDNPGDNDTAEIWVQVDTVYGNNNSQSIVMYWGKDGAAIADSSNGPAVFGTSHGAVAAWHLGGNLTDATGYGHNGVDNGSVDTADGIIGHARSFDGTSQFFHVGDIEDRPNGAISFWFRPNATFNASSLTQGIYGKKQDNSINATVSLRGTDMTGHGLPGCIMTKIEDGTNGYYDSTTITTWNAGTWYNVAWTWKNGADSLYVNGALQGASANNGSLIGGVNDEIGRSAYDEDAQTISGYRYFNGTIDEFRMDNNLHSSGWVKLNYENQKVNQTLVTFTGAIYWDISPDADYQVGGGTWGSDDFWSSNGTQLQEWPGRGYTAVFSSGAGPSDDTITVSDTQYVDSIHVLHNTYFFKGGVLDFGTKSGIYTGYYVNNTTLTIGSEITGSGGLSKYGPGTLVLAGANTYTGPTRIVNGTMSVSLLADGGTACNLGVSADEAANLVIDSAVLVYAGPAQSCNRLFSLGNNGGAITANGSGALDFSNTGAIGFTGSGSRTLTLNGTTTAANTLAAVIGDGTGGATAVTKSGTGTWVLEGASTYTGATTVAGGTLIVNGSLAAGSAVTAASGVTIGGSGTIAGSVTAKGSTILPGNAGPGKLQTGSLTLDSTSLLHFELGTISDSIAISGDLALDGVITIIPAPGYSTGTYRIFSYTGTLTNDTLTVGAAPAGSKCTFTYGAGYIDAVLSVRLLQSEPADTAMLAGQNAVFSASAIGNGTLVYKWEQYPADPVGTGTTLTLASVTGAMNGNRYRCIVTDSFSSDTSRWALMTVLDTPVITLPPHDTTVTVGSSAGFSLSLADTTSCSYSWRKSGVADELGTDRSLSIGATEMSDGGAYFCLVTNPVATVVTDTVELTVKPLPPEAKFGFSPRNGIAPLTVSFTDSSSGVISTRQWDFGDGTADTAADPEHTYSDTGTFGVILIINGPGGSDTTAPVTVRVTSPAPVARFTITPSTGLAPLEVAFTDSSTGPITSRHWYFGDGNSDTALNPKYTYTETGVYSVSLAVAGPGGRDSLVKKESVQVLEKGQNPLRIQGIQVTGNDIAVVINQVNLVDTSSPAPWCDSIGIWYMPKALPQSPDSASLAKVYQRNQLTATSLVDTLTLPLSNQVVGLMTGIFWNDGSISQFLSVNGCLVELVTAAAPVARFTFTPSTGLAPLEVAFTDASTGLINSRHWYFGDGSSDTGSSPQHTYDSSGVYTVSLAVTGPGGKDSLVKKDSLQVLEEGQNPLRITKLTYDSLTASLRISWCIDSALFSDELDIGITWSLDTEPSSMTGTQVVTAYTECTDTTVLLTSPLRFDTLYHVALFARETDSTWSQFDTSAYATVRTGHLFRQVVTFFNDSLQRDTVRAFNDKFELRKDSTYNTTSPITDTLEVYRFTPPAGFSLAGLPIRFVNALPILPVTVGIHIDSVPADAIKGDVRIYRDSAGVLLACFESTVDSVRGMVSLKTSDLRQPFIPMFDHNRPKVTFLKKSDTLAYANRNLVDSIRISDNVANVRWTFLYAKGEEALLTRESAELRDTSIIRRFVVSKDSQAISSESGLRAWLIVDDAVHRDTINLSRSVFRDSSDRATTINNVWYPLYATAQLDTVQPGKTVLSDIKKNAGDDTRHVRLFRWVETAANRENTTDKWVEYKAGDAAVQKLFTLQPGRLLWLKTRGNIPFNLGPARTLSLKDTFSIALPAGQFTDLGMPYRFGVRIKDILAASGSRVDGIRFFEWIFDSTKSRYTLDPLYVASMSDKKDPMVQLKYKHFGGYCLFNPYDSARTLRIPPIPAVMSSPSGPGKKSGTKDWCAKLISDCIGEGKLPQVYFGFVPKDNYSEYPATPTFGAVRMTIMDRRSGKHFGHYIASDAGGGLAKELWISNSSDSTRLLTVRSETAGAFPENFTTLLYDPASGKFDTEEIITIPPRSAVSRWCSIGDAAWHARFSTSAARFTYGLQQIYPNPARSLVNIAFTVPLGSQERIHLSIFDLRGRRIWEKQVDGLLMAGVHLVTWNGRDNRNNSVGAGMYLVRLAVKGNNGKVLRRFDRQITYLP